MPCRVPYFLLVVSLLTISACQKDKPVALREPVIGGTEVTYTWAATADSMQAATYTSYLGAEGTFVEYPGSTRFGGYWPNAHALHTLVDAYERTDDPSLLPRMLALLRGIKTMNGGTYSNVFNDDMLWLGNASARAYEATGNNEYLEVAELLWDDVLLSYSDVLGGGITWKKDTPNSKNAVSNGPAIVLGMRLYTITADSSYLEWARSLYDWQRANLVDPATGEVWDNVSLENGEVKTNKDWVFTYNMGTWIGAGTRLYTATGNDGYLNDAIRSAKRTTVSPKLTTEGLLRDEGQGDGGLFKGILVRYLTDLILLPELGQSDRDELVKFMQFNGETFYDQGLRRPQMLAGPNWRALPSERTDLTTQLSGLMLIEAMATLDRNNLLH